MKFTAFFLISLLAFQSCSKKDTPVPLSDTVEVKAILYNAPANPNGTGTRQWYMDISLSRPVLAAATIYVTFGNPYFTPTTLRPYSAKMPYLAKDSSRIYVAPNAVNLPPVGFRVDSVVSVNKKLIFKIL